jgi:enoyl-CoA hydratase/carnithine racemase
VDSGERLGTYFTLEKRDSCGILYMDRPPVNSLDVEFLQELAKVADSISEDSGIRSLVLTSRLKVFCGGLDLKMASKMDLNAWTRYEIELDHGFGRLLNLPKPVIAAINGAALGGGMVIALASDFRFIAEEKGSMGLPEVNIGIPLLGGSTPLLTRVVNRAVAMEIALSGNTYGSQEALSMGLVHRVFKDKELLERSVAFAQGLTEKGPIAVGMIKRCINESLRTEIEGVLPLELYAVEKTAETGDMKEGFCSFFEKRKPVYKGR